MDQLYVPTPKTRALIKASHVLGFFSRAHRWYIESLAGDSWRMDDQIQLYFHLFSFSFVFDFGFSIRITSAWSQCQW
jgi:hypothetical protein